MDNKKTDQYYIKRNRIVHEYGNVDLGVVYDTVRNDIPNLLLELKEIEE